jgi:hypothetical protein
MALLRNTRQAQKIAADKRCSVSDKEKTFYNIDSRTGLEFKEEEFTR